MVAVSLGWCESQMKALGIHLTTYLSYGSFLVTPVDPEYILFPASRDTSQFLSGDAFFAASLRVKPPGLVEHPPHYSQAQTGQVGQVQATPLLFRASGPGDVGVGEKSLSTPRP